MDSCSHIKSHDHQSLGREVATARIEAISQILSGFRTRFSENNKDIAVYLIGSIARCDKSSSKDLDILLLDTSATEPQHTVEFERLIDFMESGNPFDGAFSTEDERQRNSIGEVVTAVANSFPQLAISTSYAFGPAKNEMNIPENGLHIHVSGPLSTGDMNTLQHLFPFHAIDFLKYHRIIVGPLLSRFISITNACINDLILWDRLLYRRFENALMEVVQRKWFKRMVHNRTVVLRYTTEYRELMDRCATRKEDANSDEMRFMLQELLSSAEALAKLPPQ